MSARSVCLASLPLSEAGTGRFCGQPSSIDHHIIVLDLFLSVWSVFVKTDMAEIERAATMRIIGKRNVERRAALERGGVTGY